MRFHLGGRIFAVQILLLLAAGEALAQLGIEDSRLVQGDSPLIVRGVVYDPAPIGRFWEPAASFSSCLYARDFPLIAAMGANAIRTRTRISPDDPAFARALAQYELYWLAGFPLEPYFGEGKTLSPDSTAGAELRAEILSDFRNYAEGWRDEPRLLAFVFGDGVASGYESHFSGSAADFFTLLAEAAAVLEETAPGALLTTSAAAPAVVGSFKLASDDPRQPGLDFWSVEALGEGSLDTLLLELRNRTAKPVLISAFGIDAYDETRQSEDAAAQARAARNLARQIDAMAAGELFSLLGGLWAGWSDEWWRSGANPAIHGVGGRNAMGFPDGRLNPAWLGLFGLARSEFAGLDHLRPREAYFGIAEAWGGSPLPELSAGAPPRVAADGVRNTASGLGFLSPGGLMSVRGSDFALRSRAAPSATLPFSLGAISACIGGQPVPLYFAGEEEVRGQIPWALPAGSAPVVIYRAGRASNAVPARVERAAPGIFSRAVFRPGLPCPVDGENGVPPGSYLEIYGTGLTAPREKIPLGVPLGAPVTVPEMPRARLDDRQVEVLYAGLFPGAPGVTQTNAQIPEDFPASVVELRLEQGGFFSNPVTLRVIAAGDEPGLSLRVREPREVLIQAGGPRRRLWVTVEGRNGFCELVRFRFTGLPAGVRSSLPVGFPGQTLPLTVWAEQDAPQTEAASVSVTSLSSLWEPAAASFRVSVLPSRGDMTLKVISGGWLSKAPVASFSVAGKVLYEVTGGGAGRGFNFLTIDPETGVIGEPRNFDTWASGDEVLAMERYLQSLPEGVLVLGAIADDGFLLLRPETFRVLEQTLAAGQIGGLQYQYSWAVISRTGAAAPIAERLMPNGRAVLERVVSFPLPPLDAIAQSDP